MRRCLPYDPSAVTDALHSGRTARTADVPVHAPRACVVAEGALRSGSGDRSSGMQEVLLQVEWKGTGVDMLLVVCSVWHLPPPQHF